MAEQNNLDLNQPQQENVNEYRFEPIKGRPQLQWQGKRPFTSTQFFPAQKKEEYGEPLNGWSNKLFWGDNLQVMSHLLKSHRNSINLVYIDPPFDSKMEYKKQIKTKGKNTESNYSNFEEKQYSDIWTNDEYLQFMYERLILIRELLSENGVICLHCDWHKSHYLRCLLDEIFGEQNFQNEIVWHYYNKMQGNINRFASNHDIIYVYSKTQSFTFNKLKEKRGEPVRQIKRVWSKETQSLVNAKDEQGKVLYINSTHKTIDDVWRLSMLQPADKKEVSGYPTQKPESLLERIVLSYSNPGDLVFDCFMGSGTTQAVSAKFGRRYIGTDINLAAIQTTTKRLLEIKSKYSQNPSLYDIKNGLQADVKKGDLFEDDISQLFEVKEHYLGLEVFNVNHYDVFRNPTQAKELIIEALEIQAISQNSVFDGEKDGRLVKIMHPNRIANKADLGEILSGFNYRAWEKRQNDDPGKPVEKILLVCMGHDPQLKADLEIEAKPFKIDVEVLDVLRDQSKLEFKRGSEAKISLDGGKLLIEQFYPMNLLQKLSLQKESVNEWKELVDSIHIDWNFDGAIMQPSIIDSPGNSEFVQGAYNIPDDAGTIRVKITDLLSESWEGNING
jgi:DNA modification methylase